MQEQFLTQPVPIIFAVCQGVQQLATGAFNLLGIFDRLTVHRLPDGTEPESVVIQVVVLWTGGRGTFEEVLRVMDQDGATVREMRATFSLAGPSNRHYQISLVRLPVRSGVFTLIVGRGDEELLRQDFTLEVAPFPGAEP